MEEGKIQCVRPTRLFGTRDDGKASDSASARKALIEEGRRRMEEFRKQRALCKRDALKGERQDDSEQKRSQHEQEECKTPEKQQQVPETAVVDHEAAQNVVTSSDATSSSSMKEKAELKRFLHARNNYEQQVAELRSENKNLGHKVQNLKHTNSGLERSLSSEKSQSASLKAQVAELQSKVASLANELEKRARDVVNRLADSHSEYEADVAALEEQLNVQTRSISSLEERLGQAVEESAAQKRQVEALHAEIASKNKMAEDLGRSTEAKLEALRAENSAMRSELTRSLRKVSALEELEGERSHQQGELAAARLQSGKLQNSLLQAQKQIISLNGTLVEYQEKSKRMAAEIARKDAQIEQRCKELLAMRGDQASKEETMQRLLQQVATLRCAPQEGKQKREPPLRLDFVHKDRWLGVAQAVQLHKSKNILMKQLVDSLCYRRRRQAVVMELRRAVVPRSWRPALLEQIKRLETPSLVCNLLKESTLSKRTALKQSAEYEALLDSMQSRLQTLEKMVEPSIKRIEEQAKTIHQLTLEVERNDTAPFLHVQDGDSSFTSCSISLRCDEKKTKKKKKKKVKKRLVKKNNHERRNTVARATGKASLCTR